MERSSKKNSKGKQEKDMYHVIHKVPYGDSPYVKAKHAQVCTATSQLCFLSYNIIHILSLFPPCHLFNLFFYSSLQKKKKKVGFTYIICMNIKSMCYNIGVLIFMLF